MKNLDIAELIAVTPEHLSRLLRQLIPRRRSTQIIPSLSPKLGTDFEWNLKIERKFEIGRILHLKFENRNLRMD